MLTLLCSALYLSMIVIKRYRNRRLYHTGLKSFIVLQDLETMIRRDEDFRVIDSDSGKDITLSILTAIIGNRVQSWNDASGSKELLRAFIKAGGQKSMSLLKNTVLAGIGFASITKKKAEELVESLIKIGDLEKSDKKKAVMELLAKAEAGTKDAREKVGKFTKEVEKTVRKMSMAKKTDVEALSKKIDKLTRVVSSLEKKLAEK